MAEANEREAFIVGGKIDTPAASSIHPRILARIDSVGLARRQDILLAQLDQLVDKLDRISPLTERFSIPAKTTRDLRGQLAHINLARPGGLFLLDEIKQHLAELAALSTLEGL